MTSFPPCTAMSQKIDKEIRISLSMSSVFYPQSREGDLLIYSPYSVGLPLFWKEFPVLGVIAEPKQMFSERTFVYKLLRHPQLLWICLRGKFVIREKNHGKEKSSSQGKNVSNA